MSPWWWWWWYDRNALWEGVLREEEQTSAALFPLIARIASWVSPWLSWTHAPWQPWLSLKDIGWTEKDRFRTFVTH